MNKILITGSKGLIGATLIEELEKNSIKTVGFDIRNKSNLPQNIYYYNSLDRLESDYDGIIHLAGTSRVVWGQINPALCRLNNVLGTKNVIKKALSQTKKPWIIFASSREVYGQQETLPVVEEAQKQPMNVYAKSKCLAENLIIDARNHGLKTTIVRFSNVFGGLNDHADRVIPAFCIAALKNQKLKLEGENNIFDFTYIKDVIEGLKAVIKVLIENPQNLPAIHFVNNRGISLKEAAHIITKAANGGDLYSASPRSYDVSRFYGSNKKARQQLNWSPTHTFEEAINLFLSDLKASNQVLG
ncbi:MAG: epimerase [Rickettsiales bacterium]|nr:epimerase [Rickettsiales bacterium]|tara:strand:+ start:16043 stop:16945 length:903 start_codon:yes stop_codon:yes gene_type:complete